MTRLLHHTLLLLASFAIAAAAHASYGQMRLDGIGFFLAFALTVAYGAVVDIALFAKVFRYRAGMVGGVFVALVLIALLLAMAAAPGELAGVFKGAPGGAPLVVLLLTGAVFLPFIVFAPLAQYRTMRQNRRWPGWVTAWLLLQVALLPGFFALANTEDHFWKQDYSAGHAVGGEARAGGLGRMLQQADQLRERIWGTAWTHARRQDPSGRYPARQSGWVAGLAKALDDSALIAANEPLGEADRTVMRILIERHLARYAIPKIKAKLIWDALEPGRFAKQLAPNGPNEQGVADDEVIPLLLERLEAHAGSRLCPDGRMMEADRALLGELVLARVHSQDEARKRELQAELDAKKREAELLDAPFPFSLLLKATNTLENMFGGQDVKVPDWSSYPQRIERLCGGPQ